jgi:cytoskeleton protein RodZ
VTDSQALPISPTSPFQESSVGDTLRRTREAQGMSISEVASSLKLNVRQIDALESGRFDLLPGFAFTRGFLRNYARLLKIDAAPLLAAMQSPAEEASVELAPASNAQGNMPQVGRGRFRRSVLPGVIAALGLFGIVVAGWYYDIQRKKSTDDLVASLPVPAAAEAPAAPEQAPAAQAAASVVPATVAVAEAPVPAQTPVVDQGVAAQVSPQVIQKDMVEPVKPASGDDHLVFEFAKDAWVEVKDRNGKIVFSQLGKAGSRQEFDGKAPLSLVVGNARFVKLERNGTPVDMGASTKVTVARFKLE